MRLNDLKPGQIGFIDCIDGDCKLCKRLHALGCIEGTPIKVIKAAPLGDPIMINIRGFHLAIRKKDANNIEVKEA